MLRYIIKRVIYALAISFAIMSITFVLLRFSPASPADRYLANLAARGENIEEAIKAIEARYGLNKPLHEQYFDYMRNLLKGNLGWSIATSMPVAELIKKHWIYSFQLVFLSTIIAIISGIFLGIVSAIRQNESIDYAVRFFSLIGISIPNFWLGIMLILIFSVKLGIFKTYYDTSLPLFSLANLKALILPVLTLSTGMIAAYTRYTRNSILEYLRKDFVKTARAKGLKERTIIFKHVLRNAMLPIITIIMFDMSGVVFGGAYLTEIIFGIPGLGLISYNAVFQQDYAVVIAITLISSFIVIIFNLFADIAYAFLDPRIRYESEKV